MSLEKFSSGFKNIINNITTSKSIKEDIDKVVKEIQKELIKSDVNIKLVLELSKNIKEKVMEIREVSGIDRKELLIKIIYEELILFLGDGEEFKLKEGVQNKLLLVGLYGQGKTTTTAKVANYFKLRGKKVAVISTDTYRPAAQEQLKQLAQKIELDYFIDEKEKNPDKLFKKYSKKLEEYDLVIVDSAGRDSLNKELVSEVEKLNKQVKPTDTFLVIGADIGQNAQKQAQDFKDKLNITGVIITKLDGTGKGGGALSACKVVNSPVRFIGVGEKINDFEKFNSKNFVSQILGMGDIETLLEKAKVAQQENLESEENLKKRLQSGLFDLNDLYNQTKAMGKMGGMSKIMNLVPGMSKFSIPKEQLETQEVKMKKWRYLLDSMTKQEKKEPQVINSSRIQRITKGSGCCETELREFLKQHKVMKKMFSSFNPNNMSDENMNEESIQNMMGGMKNPQEMLKMAKKMGLGGKMLKGLMKKK